MIVKPAHMSVSDNGVANELDSATAGAEFESASAVGRKLDKLENRAVWLDAEFRLPFTEFRVGVSTIVGLLPGVGDGAMMVLAATLVYHGMRLGAPTWTLVKMSVILLIEGLVGAIPIVGDLVGLVWSANVGNVGRLRRHEETLDDSTNWLFVLLLASPFILFVLALGSLL
jgi:hypothetical protein